MDKCYFKRLDGGVYWDIDSSEYTLVLRDGEGAIKVNCVYTDCIKFGTGYSIIQSITDLPIPVGNIIYLPANTSWRIVGTLDLLGNKIVCLGNVVLLGNSSETSSIISTGLPNGHILISSNFTLPIHDITLGCPVNCSILYLSGDGSNGLDMRAVNFGGTGITCGTAGYISGYSNVIINDSSFLTNTAGITFTGTIGTIGFSGTLFTSSVCVGGYIILPNTLTITRRLRFTQSSFVVFDKGINYTGAVMPNTSLFCINVNFSGPGVYLVGFTTYDIISEFIQCIGVSNSTSIGQLNITGNTLPTIVVKDVWTEIVGVDVVGLSARFNETDVMELTYIGGYSQFFNLNASTTIIAGNNKNIGIAYSVNGVLNINSKRYLTSTGSGDISILSTHTVVALNKNDVVKVLISNTTDSTNVTVTFAEFSITIA